METKYAVQLINNGHTFYLKGTTWTSAPERASLYASPVHAQEALEKAKKFMARKSDAKKAVIVTM